MSDPFDHHDLSPDHVDSPPGDGFGHLDTTQQTFGHSGGPLGLVDDLLSGLGAIPETLGDFTSDILELVGLHDPGVFETHADDLIVAVGDVDNHSDNWHDQGDTNGCAVAAQGSIIEALTGQPFDLDATLTALESRGWYHPDHGTSHHDLTRLFEINGITHQAGYATVVDVYDALARGDLVMVTLDAHEIWYPADDPVTGLPVEHRDAGHAVWVTGMGVDPDTGEWMVVLNDSGTTDGRNASVPLDDFVNATSDFGGYSVFVDGSQSAGSTFAQASR